ncbi:uL22m family ribosomal protein [Candidatus Nesciobacter abundans]|uniref:50S ribosomal protein L22 n=1 Tax=Candidatus Nesciobacter abundans TaxID=2601668 RepID=A0A5C0UFM9_9PROT|nr:uL22 family ribosomal protein [Candidatus Nesciobacter abundans]QEK38906.1 50S ribosomal protein L22 family protein [Candidatus Nesciobacter abundans]
MINKEIISYAKSSMHGKAFKLSLIAKRVRRGNANLASARLAYYPGKYALALKKTIDSAVANAKQKGASSDLIIDSIDVGIGTYAKRIEIKGRGRVGSKYKAHCNFIVRLVESK